MQKTGGPVFGTLISAAIRDRDHDQTIAVAETIQHVHPPVRRPADGRGQ